MRETSYPLPKQSPWPRPFLSLFFVYLFDISVVEKYDEFWARLDVPACLCRSIWLASLADWPWAIFVPGHWFAVRKESFHFLSRMGKWQGRVEDVFSEPFWVIPNAFGNLVCPAAFPVTAFPIIAEALVSPLPPRMHGKTSIISALSAPGLHVTVAKRSDCLPAPTE